MSYITYNGKRVLTNGKSVISTPPVVLTVYDGDMTVGTYTFMTVTAYGFNTAWPSTPGSLNPASGDIFNIYWASNTEKIYITFFEEILNLGTVEIDDVEIEFEISDLSIITSVADFPTNPFNDVGQISTINISYKLGES